MLIGLHGFAQSGKDTTYQFIKKEFHGPGMQVVRDAFADRMVLSLARIFNPDIDLPAARDWWDAFKDSGHLSITTDLGTEVMTVDGRSVGQRYGDEAHRKVFGQDVWVDLVLPDWQDDDYGRNDGLTRQDVLVLTDVRYPNEAERVLDCGGSVWHIVRPSADIGDQHTSERVLMPEYITTTIENRTTLEALRTKVTIAMWNELAHQVA